MGGFSDELKYYVIVRHHDVTSWQCQFKFLTFIIIFHQTGQLWRSVTNVAIDAEDLRFNSQAGQIRHRVANGSPPLRRFFRPVLPKR